ncbi:MoxR family ATPase [Acidiferrimicrobium sp. IK]|uniref:AAA family ATPase n=1 Tax=Acidiferrimicrobium sp. IK TaxID=2871700 RepID=UPI0021CB7CC4|nr:MoxR family ATPase [Acidiferrimicrobium sp. IK]MCU4185282.1 MoxR family ATPase [Acidiferrimicrobium sp. IK]
MSSQSPPDNGPAPISDSHAAWFAERHQALLTNLERAIKGKNEVLRLALCCLFAEGHLLIEDVPGVGKTSIAKAVAASIDSSWRRIQFTPDLLPSDITGVSIWDQHNERFEFHKGPVFANLVLGDEINRASPKTQSALLEVMEERQVTVDAVSYPVPQPFLVLATQNPIDLDGTYRLPEAQLDRFLMRISVGYPDAESEAAILDQRAVGGRAPALAPVLDAAQVMGMIRIVARVHVDPEVSRYVVALARATRAVPEVRLGLSPRGALAVLRAAQSRAVADGRTYVVPQDVKAVTHAVAGHRLVLTPEAEVQGRRVDDLLDGVLASVSVPAPA